jgi:hypothetical protein
VSAIFLAVLPCLSGYVATSRYPDVTAVGATPAVAVENAILGMHAAVRAYPPPTLIVCSQTAERGTIIMQAIDKPIRLDLGRVAPLQAAVIGKIARMSAHCGCPETALRNGQHYCDHIALCASLRVQRARRSCRESRRRH